MVRRITPAKLMAMQQSLVNKRQQVNNLTARWEELYNEVLRNQDLYMNCYIDTLKINNPLTREMKKIEARRRKLDNEIDKLENQINIIQMRGY